jgi:hypothetical protein
MGRGKVKEGCWRREEKEREDCRRNLKEKVLEKGRERKGRL